MKNNITEVVFIIDRSGSMSGFEADTIGGFNSMIEKQKGKDGTVYISTVLFSNASEVIHDRVSVDKIRPMTESDYCVGGCTALLDAIGDAVRHIGNIHKYARPEDVPDNTVFVITTDGMENASHKYSSSEIKKLIEKKKNECGWEFLFLAANIDAVETAENIGIQADRAVNYNQNCKGVKLTYAAMSDAITSVRNGKKLERSAWREDLDKDNEVR